ncbi:MAG: hypothetical protein U0521_17730 [Anaerolineae bacterium]
MNDRIDERRKGGRRGRRGERLGNRVVYVAEGDRGRRGRERVVERQHDQHGSSAGGEWQSAPQPRTDAAQASSPYL